MKKTFAFKSGAMLLSLSMLSMALVGCGSNNNEKTTNNQPAATNQQAATNQTANNTAEDPTQMTATVKIWDWDEAFQQGMIAEFKGLSKHQD